MLGLGDSVADITRLETLCGHESFRNAVALCPQSKESGLACISRQSVLCQWVFPAILQQHSIIIDDLSLTVPYAWCNRGSN